MHSQKYLDLLITEGNLNPLESHYNLLNSKLWDRAESLCSEKG